MTIIRFDVIVDLSQPIGCLQGAIEAVTEVGQVMNRDRLAEDIGKSILSGRSLNDAVLHCEMDIEDMWTGAQQYEELRDTLNAIASFTFRMPVRPEIVS